MFHVVLILQKHIYFNLVLSNELHLMELYSLTNQLHTLASVFGHKWKRSSK